MKVAEGGNPRVCKGETAQGFYIAAADGTFYGFNNNRSVERVSGLMDEALASFRGKPPAAVEIPPAELEAAWAAEADAKTSVVRVFSRIRPLPPGSSTSNTAVGRDHLRIYEDDVRAMLAAAEKAGNAEFPMPAALALRLVRFHLIDNVRGEPDMWTAEQVKKAEFVMRRSDGGTSRPGSDEFEIHGAFAMEYADRSRGQVGALDGRVCIDRASRRVRRFRAYSEGQAWGASTYTSGAPEGRFPIVIAMIEADDEISRLTPPQALGCGNDEYVHPRAARPK
jgi:hypothetical protein